LLDLPKRRQRAIFLGYELNFLLSLTFSEQLADRLLRAIKKTLGSACCLLAVRSYPLLPLLEFNDAGASAARS
jgi:hypothetical protein